MPALKSMANHDNKPNSGFPGFAEFYCADRTHNEKETETDKYRNDQQIIPAERIRNKFCAVSVTCCRLSGEIKKPQLL